MNTRFSIDLNDFTHDDELDNFYKLGSKHYFAKGNNEISLLLIPNDKINGIDVFWHCNDDNTYTHYIFTHYGEIINGMLYGTLFNGGILKSAWD